MQARVYYSINQNYKPFEIEIYFLDYKEKQ